MWVNTHHRNDPSSPWYVSNVKVCHTWDEPTWYRGGMKESGIGRENGIEAFEACTYTDPRVEHT